MVFQFYMTQATCIAYPGIVVPYGKEAASVRNWFKLLRKSLRRVTSFLWHQERLQPFLVHALMAVIGFILLLISSVLLYQMARVAGYFLPPEDAEIFPVLGKLVLYIGAYFFIAMLIIAVCESCRQPPWIPLFLTFFLLVAYIVLKFAPVVKEAYDFLSGGSNGH
jgi:cell division protein FtsW (lipid II flippase)